jgi:16S rRNA (uracil1498-N3)-methyltransferase
MTRRFYTPEENIDGQEVMLDESETRHLRDVLRMEPGDEVRVFDGAGAEYSCAIVAIEKRSARLRILTRVEPAAPESPLDLTVAAAITKGDRFDLVVQKSVELGVRRLIPLVTKRCDVRMKDGGKRVERWRKIALESSKQCGRAYVMEIGEVCSPGSLFEQVGERRGILFFSERDGAGLPAEPRGVQMIAVFGPEGGWDDLELKLARAAGATVVTLGGRILRAETAAIGVTAILQHRFGDLR